MTQRIENFGEIKSLCILDRMWRARLSIRNYRPERARYIRHIRRRVNEGLREQANLKEKLQGD